MSGSEVKTKLSITIRKPKDKKERNWCFTAWENPSLYPGFYDDLNCTYWIQGNEICPDSGKEHWQGYLELKGQLMLKTLNAHVAFHGMTPFHWETRWGTQEEAIEYCKKDNHFLQNGKPKHQGERTDLTAMANMIRDGATDLDLVEAHPGNFIRYHKGLQVVRGVYESRRRERSEVSVFWGETGTGKSYRAFKLGGDDCDVVSYHNGFIQGYTGAPTVIIEEFCSKEWKRSLFLQLIDENPLKVNVKGGEREWNPRHIIFTSNYDPSEWFAQITIGADLVEKLKPDTAVIRRLFKTEGNMVVHCDKPYLPDPLPVFDDLD